MIFIYAVHCNLEYVFVYSIDTYTSHILKNNLFVAILHANKMRKCQLTLIEIQYEQIAKRQTHEHTHKKRFRLYNAKELAWFAYTLERQTTK